MQIASWNVNSITVRLPHLLNWLSDAKVDHLGLQELKTVEDKFPYNELSEAGYSCQVKGEKTYNGVAVLSRSNAELVANELPGAPEPIQSRFIEVLLQEDIYLLNLYVPNGSEVGSSKYEYKLKWFDALLSYIENNHNPDDMLVIMGDFNIAPEDRDVHDPDLWKGQVLVSPKERECFQRLLDLGLTDSFRELNSEGGNYSWWDYRNMAFKRNDGLRIDHVLISQPLVPLLTNAWIDVDPRKLEKPSDHCPVGIDLDV